MGDRVAPPATVLRAFGVEVVPRPLPGGQGTSWRAGDLVLKPGCGPVDEWLAGALEGVVADGVRIAAAIPTRHGTRCCEGWSATGWAEGSGADLSRPSAVLGVIEAGRAFHRAIAHLQRPDCLDARNDWWAVADRIAWGERAVRFRPDFADVARRLQRALRPPGPAQVVHLDLTGNVLFHPTLPPAVIDVSPYWRPPEYAEGVVVADALCWHGARAPLLDLAGVPVAAVARALLFRMATTDEAVASGGVADVHDEARRYDVAATLIGL